MREILFRGQTRRNGEQVWMSGEKVPGRWVYGGVLQGCGAHSIIYGGENADKPSEGLNKWPVYTDTLGQYAGIPDKNGKKIFDGDIFLVQGMEAWVNGLYIVEFSEANHCWWLRNPNPYGRSFSFSDLNGFHLDGMVIGNIYDNPELLKGGGADA